jgi:putative acetyltransferase
VVIVREERASDVEAIRNINRLAFGGDEEADLVDALRAGGHVIASLVATDGDAVVGHILFSPLAITTETGAIAAAALAPVAVLPEQQRRGIGSALIRRGLELCTDRGCVAVVVVGHPDYYPRFGFSAELARPLRAPFSGPAFMALELVPGSLSGVEGTVRYAPPFGLT